jgi:fatty acid desaturase
MEITASTYRPKFALLEGAKLYKELHERVKAAQLFKRSYTFYALHALFVLMAIAISWYFLAVTANTILFSIIAILLAMCLSQLGGYMHDAAHMMILKTKIMNDVAGTICASLALMNYNAWKIKHNAHHGHPNQEGHDPDIDIPLFSFTGTRYASKTGLVRVLRRYQAYVYFPLTFLLAYSFQFKNNIEYFIREVKTGFRLSILGEMSLHLGGFFLWYVLPFLVFDLLKAVLFITIVPATVGFYIASVFAPNHKGMPVLDRNARLSFLEHQIITSRNIADNWFTDFIYLSLNYQIEHHLFPDCPRNKLKLVTPYIKELCRMHGLPFTVVDLRESFGVILNALSSVVREAEHAVVYRDEAQ